MKKLLWVLFALSVIATSCKKTNQELIENNNTPLSYRTTAEGFELKPEYFDRIGQAHNEGLDYVLEHMVNVNPNSSLQDVNQSAVEFVFNVNPETISSLDNRDLLNTSEHLSKITDIILARSIIAKREELIDKLTSKQLYFIDKLDTILSSTLFQFEEGITQIRELEEHALEILNDDEIVYFLCVTNLARHSLEYWFSEKGLLWLEIIESGSNEPYAKGIDWRNVAVADVAAFIAGFPAGVNTGAIVGGLTAGIASAGITAGVGAVLGGIVGGTATGLASAITASSYVLAAEILLSWW